jgi:transcriptional antiterminator NusG
MTMSEEDEIKQDASERQMDSIPELAETGEPTGPSESAAADEPVGAAVNAGAVTDEQANPPVEGMSATVEQAELPPEESEARQPAQIETDDDAPQAEPVPVTEPVVEAMAETGSEVIAATVEIQATSEEANVEAPSLEEAPQAEADEAEPTMAAVETPPQADGPEPTMAAVETPFQADEAGAEQAEPADVDDDRHWYVVHCYSGYENKVRHNLEQRIESMGMKDKIFDVVVPTEEEIEVKEGKRRTVERRVFPGYILVQMIMTEESWYVVRNTPGVTGFVGMGNEPTPLRPEEVAQIIRRMEAEAPRVKVTYKIDQKVRIIDGPFNDFIGTVDDIDMERAKVRVMVSFFGRETPVELDFLQVEKA